LAFLMALFVGISDLESFVGKGDSPEIETLNTGQV